MKKQHLYASAAALVFIIAAGLTSNAFLTSANANSNQAEASIKVVDTSQAVAAANWTDNVSITLNKDDNTFRYQSDGIPAYGLAENYLVPNDPSTMPFADDPADSFWTLSSSDIEESPIDQTITTLPKYSQETTETSLGQIGVAINGAKIFNDYEDMERNVVALDDNVIHDHAAFVDECNGHPLGDGTNYHYHGVPLCISDKIDQDGEHSYMIGVLQDGFPAYSSQGVNGVIMTNSDLDECGGHFGPTPEFPDGIYHYHLTADEAPYSIDCYHGEVEIARRGGGGPDLTEAASALGIEVGVLREALGNSGPPDFDAAAKTLGISVDELMAVMPAPPGQ